MNKLVHHHEVEPLLGGHGLVHIAEGGDADAHEIEGNGVRGPGSVVAEILQEDVDLFRRPVIEEATLEGVCVLEAIDDMGNEVLVGFRVIDEPQMVRLALEKLGVKEGGEQ